jgi:hypothetical protein
MKHKPFLMIMIVSSVLVLAACAGRLAPRPGWSTLVRGQLARKAGWSEGPAGADASVSELTAADLTCTECHNDTTLIWSKEAQFRERSIHGTGEAFERGETASCAGCHGTEGAKARINDGLPPHDPSIEGVTNVSPFDCRLCHNIHTTYTGADFSLTGDQQPVKMEYSDGTFDGGEGNLCANCHQIRNEQPVAAMETSRSILTVRYAPRY